MSPQTNGTKTGIRISQLTWLNTFFPNSDIVVLALMAFCVIWFWSPMGQSDVPEGFSMMCPLGAICPLGTLVYWTLPKNRLSHHRHRAMLKEPGTLTTTELRQHYEPKHWSFPCKRGFLFTVFVYHLQLGRWITQLMAIRTLIAHVCSTRTYND